jgi:hypothetical protein
MIDKRKIKKFANFYDVFISHDRIPSTINLKQNILKIFLCKEKIYMYYILMFNLYSNYFELES